jgi:hypothetical protein
MATKPLQTDRHTYESFAISIHSAQLVISAALCVISRWHADDNLKVVFADSFQQLRADMSCQSRAAIKQIRPAFGMYGIPKVRMKRSTQEANFVIYLRLMRTVFVPMAFPEADQYFSAEVDIFEQMAILPQGINA